MTTVRQLWNYYKGVQTLARGKDATFDGRPVGTPLENTYWWGRNVITELYARGETVRNKYLINQLLSDADTNSPMYRELMRCNTRTLVAFMKRLDNEAIKVRNNL